ncbi:DUF433 domain-containing protein [Actinoplanes sp. TRM 88003]|uniref:DUF433 domain-containing protein n=1 Tax=Paractinoplanes aksuensis TaxID=2939490 RepID=A0ABT1DRQ7_9ACTN|nr:DUF433 domain-containing protein [Actinoplanes aksuensis]MCO8273504.1 DUF433 domain-containing protein [Actinoplanes aksuensis]
MAYSFRDLVALRTFVYLREACPLPSIRRALDRLSVTGHLSQYRLVDRGRRRIALVHNAGDGPGRAQVGPVDLVEQPGQQITVIKFGDVLRSFSLGDVEIPDLVRPRQRISVDPSVRHGCPVVAGTRVDFDLVAGLVRDGVPPKAVKEYYPGVTAAAARDAASFADYVDLGRAAQQPDALRPALVRSASPRAVCRVLAHMSRRELGRFRRDARGSRVAGRGSRVARRARGSVSARLQLENAGRSKCLWIGARVGATVAGHLWTTHVGGWPKMQESPVPWEGGGGGGTPARSSVVKAERELQAEIDCCGLDAPPKASR